MQERQHQKLGRRKESIGQGFFHELVFVNLLKELQQNNSVFSEAR